MQLVKPGKQGASPATQAPSWQTWVPSQQTPAQQTPAQNRQEATSGAGAAGAWQAPFTHVASAAHSR